MNLVFQVNRIWVLGYFDFQFSCWSGFEFRGILVIMPGFLRAQVSESHVTCKSQTNQRVQKEEFSPCLWTQAHHWIKSRVWCLLCVVDCGSHIFSPTSAQHFWTPRRVVMGRQSNQIKALGPSGWRKLSTLQKNMQVILSDCCLLSSSLSQTLTPFVSQLV